MTIICIENNLKSIAAPYDTVHRAKLDRLLYWMILDSLINTRNALTDVMRTKRNKYE